MSTRLNDRGHLMKNSASGGPNLRTLERLCASQVSSIGTPLRRRRGRRRGASRALARVIAHELVHALAPGLPHGRRGLMSQSLGAALVASRRAFAIDYVRSLRAGLAALAAHGPAPWRAAERIASSP